MPKVYIKTYGCQMNEYDAQKIKALLIEKEHMTLVDAPEEANLIIVVTCSVREKAAEKLFSDLGRWRNLKKSNPNLMLAVGGCVPSHEKENILKRAPYVDVVFGPQTFHRLPLMLRDAREHKKPVIDVSFPEVEKFDALPEPKLEGPSAFISIMEGCNKHCTYCIVPYTRGKEFSRPAHEVINEIQSLAKQGAREITLLGQNVNHYHGMGSDPTCPTATVSLSQLLYEVSTIDGIDRIRFMTSHPLAFSDDLIRAFKEIPKLANHLHLPVQSGSNRILKRMGRGYTTEQFKEKMMTLRMIRPNISLSSDFIVGFPGETEEDFDATLQLVKEIGFDHSFSFIYSPRPGTPAIRLPDDVTLTVKKERLSRLKTLLNEIEMLIRKKMVNTIQNILVAGASKKNPLQLSGRTENNCVVNFDGDPSMMGQFVNVRITENLPNSLRGIRIQPDE